MSQSQSALKCCSILVDALVMQIVETSRVFYYSFYSVVSD